MISVILPSRGRPQRLTECCKSLKELAADPKNVEIVVRLDQDDPHIYSEAFQQSDRDCSYLIGNRGSGYARNDMMIEECARWCHGDIIMQYVDTAIMRTKDWDRIMRDAAATSNNGVFVMFPHVAGGAGYQYCFPAISRKLYEICGCFCIGSDPSVDRCWEAFADNCKQCVIPVHVTVEHNELRGSRQEDQTAKETNEFYWELTRNWNARNGRHREIGKKYADIVRYYLEDSGIQHPAQ